MEKTIKEKKLQNFIPKAKNGNIINLQTLNFTMYRHIFKKNNGKTTNLNWYQITADVGCDVMNEEIVCQIKYIVYHSLIDCNAKIKDINENINAINICDDIEMKDLPKLEIITINTNIPKPPKLIPLANDNNSNNSNRNNNNVITQIPPMPPLPPIPICNKKTSENLEIVLQTQPNQHTPPQLEKPQYILVTSGPWKKHKETTKKAIKKINGICLEDKVSDKHLKKEPRIFKHCAVHSNTKIIAKKWWNIFEMVFLFF